jgi:hypothetical protein
MTIKKIIFILLPCFHILIPSRAYGQEWKTKFDAYFNNIRANTPTTLPVEINDNSLAEDILNSLEPYFIDSIASVRIRSYELCHFITSTSPTRAIRTLGVDLLLSACKSGDAQTTGIVLNMLKTFDNNDFSQTAKAYVSDALQDNAAHLAEWTKLAGFLDLRALIPRIKTYSQPGKTPALRWAALLSLARLQQAWAIEEIMVRVRRLPLNDDLVYRIFPDLIFTRQRAPIDYMVEVLHQDNASCLTADVENEQSIPCGYRVMEQLARVIDGFPLEVGEGGDVITADYPTALTLVRKWFRMNNNYHILENRF